MKSLIFLCFAHSKEKHEYFVFHTVLETLQTPRYQTVIRYEKRFPLETQFERIYLSTLWLLHVKWPLVKCTLPVGWIIIDISQNGFSINWTTRSSTPFTQGPRGKGVGLGGVYFLRGWSTMHAWQFLTLVSIASSIPSEKKKWIRRDCLVLTTRWWVSCANFRISFRNDCGTTIRFSRRTIPSRLDNSSLYSP